MEVGDLTYLADFQQATGGRLKTWFEKYNFSNQAADLGYNIQTSAVYSANIEGNTVDVNTFMNSLMAARNFKPGKEIQEIADLVEAYEFAKTHALDEKNFLHAHKLLSNTLLVKDKRGKYRTDRIGVFDDTGLVYLAIEPELVKARMKTFFKQIQILLSHHEENIEILFYHAACIHLIFAHIHPFWDGNGRSARLLEKWFLSAKINSRAWQLTSEKYYRDHLQDYYRNINLGVNYYELDYGRCLDFLLMLPNSLED